MRVPDVRYVRSGDVHIAYQVLGEGPDLVVTPAGWNHLLVRWELPANERFMRRLATFARLILWDKRGTGMSDRHGEMPTLDAQLGDLRAVLDAVGSERATLFGIADGAILAALFAATHPERVAHAILYAFSPRFMPGDDGRGVSPQFLAALRSGASPEEMLDLLAPSVGDDSRVAEWWRRQAMMAVTPGTVAQLTRVWMDADVTPVLDALRVPTTIIQRTGDRVIPPANGRFAAERIRGARYVEMPGDFATWSGDLDELALEIEEAVTGTRHEADPDRTLTTILFTDIVDSTASAAALGDAVWRVRLDEHDAFVLRQLERFDGRFVKSLGDGILATFDSPARAIRCAAAIVEGMQARGAVIRAGVHTGECERRGDDVGGIAVHIAARVGAQAQPGEVLVTGTVRDLVVGSGLTFADRGEHALRGVPGTWRLLALA